MDMVKLIKILCAGVIFLIGCGGGGSNPDIKPIANVSTSQMAFTFSDTTALLLSGIATIYETDLGTVTTNLSKILEDGTMAPAFAPSSSDSLSSATITVGYFIDSPAGDIHIMFYNPILLDSEDCYWIVIKMGGQVSCVNSSALSFYYLNYIENNLAFTQASSSDDSIAISLPAEVTQLEFNLSGDVFISPNLQEKFINGIEKTVQLPQYLMEMLLILKFTHFLLPLMKA